MKNLKVFLILITAGVLLCACENDKVNSELQTQDTTPAVQEATVAEPVKKTQTNNTSDQSVATQSKPAETHSSNSKNTSSSVTPPQSSYSSHSSTKKSTYEDTYDDGYDDIYYDGDYDMNRYYNDSDYANGVDDAMDELGEDW